MVPEISVWAENGTRETIPADAQSDGSVSYDQGWTAAYATNPALSGARNLTRAQMNGVLHDLSAAIKATQVAINGGMAADSLGVSSIAELRESQATDEVIAFVRGYSELSDMGGGVFYKDASDTTSADDGGCVIVDAANQRWKRSFKYVVRPEWFGAKGDGVTDDSAAFQAALDSISPPTIAPGGGDAAITGGGCLALSSRTYVISSTLHIGPYTCIAGDGLSPWQQSHGGPSPEASKGPVLLWTGADTAGVLHAVPYVVATGARFSDDTYTIPVIDADAAAVGGAYTLCQGVSIRNVGVYAPDGAKFGLRLSLCPTSRVDGLSTYNCDTAIVGEANWESGVKNCVLTTFDVGYAGSSGQHAINFDNCWFHGGDRSATAVGVRLDYSAGVVITAPSLEDLATGIFCTSSEGLTVLGGQCERVSTLMRVNQSKGFRWIGGDLYNPVAGGAWNTACVFDGYTCEAVIDGLQVDHPNYPSGEQSYPGKWLGPTVNGNTVNLTVRGNLPRAGDGIPSPSAGAIVFDVGTEIRTYLGGEVGKNDLLYRGGAFVGMVERSHNGEVHFTGSSGQQIVTVVEDGSAQIGLNEHRARWVYHYSASGAAPSAPLGATNYGSFAFNNANGDLWVYGPAGWKKAITYAAL